MQELTRSQTAETRGIDNFPAEEEVCANLVRLVDEILDPLREAYGKPINVNSGYRCALLNRTVGGASNSQHIRGMAADIVGTPNNRAENQRLFNLAMTMHLPFEQLIFEKGNVKEGPDWVHISIAAGKRIPRRHILYLGSR